MWMLLKDAVDFCRRHYRVLLALVLPVQLILVLLFELSGVDDFFATYMEQLSQAQKSSDPQSLEMPTLPLSSALLFLTYLIAGVYPVALVIVYVQRIFSAANASLKKVNTIAIPLWLAIIALYCITWGGIIIAGLLMMSALSAIGLMPSVLSFLLMAYFGACIYIHHRLSLAPYFYAQEKMTLVQALRLSWQYARSVVAVLMLGNFLVYVAVVVTLSGMGYVFQNVLPQFLHQTIDLAMSLGASLAGVVQIVFIYRVFAFVTESKPANV